MLDGQAKFIGGLTAAAIVGFIAGRLSNGQSASPTPKTKKSVKLPSSAAESDHIPAKIMEQLLAEDHKEFRDHETGGKRTVIVVAKDLPVKMSKKNDKFDVAWHDARNFLANIRVLEEHGLDVKFVGLPSVDVKPFEQEDVRDALEKFQCYPVFLPDHLKEGFFTGFCKGVLWPMLHYLLPQNNFNFGRDWDAAWKDYENANIKFAMEVNRLIDSENAIVWVHNYHLMLLPQSIRRRHHNATIGIFIHTPWPSSDVLRVLPCREEIIRGLLNADLVGFHTFDYARHFLSACKRLLDLDHETMPGGMMGVNCSGRYVSVLTSHVGIASEQFQTLSNSDAVMEAAQKIKKQFKGRKIILGLDDLDLVKGSLLKLQAFERFLSNAAAAATHEAPAPAISQQIVLLQCILPTSTGQEERDRVRLAMDEEIARIRSLHGNDVIAVRECPSLDFAEVTALYLAADVAFVSTFWDGLNTIPYEYTASQRADNPGALVVSEFMGCSRSLSGVQRVNPWGLETVASAIAKALSYSVEERVAFHRRRMQYVMEHSARQWARDFVKHLTGAAKLRENFNFVQLGFGSRARLVALRHDFTHLDDALILPQYRSAKERVILLDYDGTLTPIPRINSEFSTGIPAPQVLEILNSLCADPANVVFIVSGRSRVKLAEFFGHMPNLGLCAEKGTFVKWPTSLLATRKEMNATSGKKPPRIPPTPAPVPAASASPESSPAPVVSWEVMTNSDLAWKSSALKLMRQYNSHTDGAWIEEKESSLTWHYADADPDYGRMQAAELEKYFETVVNSEFAEVVRSDYNRLLEIKLKGVDKGATTDKILATVRHRATKREEMARAEAGIHAETGPIRLCPLVLAIGDDNNDEDMFSAVLRQAQMEQDEEDEIDAFASRRGLSSRAPSVTAATFAEELKLEDDEFGGSMVPPSPIHALGQAPSRMKYSCCVGIKPSEAQFYVNDDEEVLALLHTLATCSTRSVHKRA